LDPIGIIVDGAVSLAACFWAPTEPPGSALERLPPRPSYTGKSKGTPGHNAPRSGP
jgi:hypothetical protein